MKKIRLSVCLHYACTNTKISFEILVLMVLVLVLK